MGGYEWGGMGVTCVAGRHIVVRKVDSRIWSIVKVLVPPCHSGGQLCKLLYQATIFAILAMLYSCLGFCYGLYGHVGALNSPMKWHMCFVSSVWAARWGEWR